MAIKVKLGATENTQQEKPFPKLMKHEDGTITFFSSFEKGTHIYAVKELEHIIGITTNGISMSKFTDYNEPITIQNL
jgi:hypothetical protein